MTVELVHSEGRAELLFGAKTVTLRKLNDYLSEADTAWKHAVIVAAIRCGMIEKSSIRKAYPSIFYHCLSVWEQSSDIQHIIETAREYGMRRPTPIPSDEEVYEENISTGISSATASIHPIEGVFLYGPWRFDRRNNSIYFHGAGKALQQEKQAVVLETLFQTPETLASKETLYHAMFKRDYRKGETHVGTAVHEIRTCIKQFTGREAPIETQKGGYMLSDARKDW